MNRISNVSTKTGSTPAPRHLPYSPPRCPLLGTRTSAWPFPGVFPAPPSPGHDWPPLTTSCSGSELKALSPATGRTPPPPPTLPAERSSLKSNPCAQTCWPGAWPRARPVQARGTWAQSTVGSGCLAATGLGSWRDPRGRGWTAEGGAAPTGPGMCVWGGGPV